MRKIILTVMSLVSFYYNGLTFDINNNTEISELLRKVDSVVVNMQTLHFKVLMYARMRGKDYDQLSEFKINRTPLKIYYKQFYGNNIELIYNQIVDENKALVNPDGFPYTSIRLSPMSTYILEKQHHSVFDADPQFILKQIKLGFFQEKSKFNANLSDTMYKGEFYKKIIIEDKSYKLKTVRINKKISLIEFAQSIGVNYYSIVWFNKDLDVDSNLKIGTLIKVPSSYAKSFILLINPKTYLIKYIEIIDNDGVYEWFEYQSFTHDILFSADEFDSENPKYNF